MSLTQNFANPHYSQFNSFSQFCQKHDTNLNNFITSTHKVYEKYRSKLSSNDDNEYNNAINNFQTELSTVYQTYPNASQDYYSIFKPDHAVDMLTNYLSNSIDYETISAYVNLIEQSPQDYMCLHHNRNDYWLLNLNNTLEIQNNNSTNETLPNNKNNNDKNITNNFTQTSHQTPILCPRFPDNNFCWPVTEANTTIYLPCDNDYNVRASLIQHILNGEHHPEIRIPHRFSASKRCDSFGRWELTNFDGCDELSRMISLESDNSSGSDVSSVADPFGINQESNVATTSKRPSNKFLKILRLSEHLIYILSFISLTSCLISIFIYQYFKNLQCTRTTIHKHLIISFVMYHFFGILTQWNTTSMTAEVKQKEPSLCVLASYLHDNGFWLCKIGRTFGWYAEISNVAWMFCEALFLHYQIHAHVFSDSLKLTIFYLIGWIAPLLFAIPLFGLTFIENINFREAAQQELLNGTITIAEYETTMLQFICFTRQDTYTSWFVTVPIIFVLFVNMVILTVIIKTVVNKLRVTTDKVTMKALKSTCLLLPLLGCVQFLTLYNPFFDQLNLFDGIWHIANVIFRNLQGFIVCVCYVFTNSEVLRTLKRQYGHRMDTLKPKLSTKSTTSSFSTRSFMERSRSTQRTTATNQENQAMLEKNGSISGRSPSQYSVKSGSHIGYNGSYHGQTRGSAGINNNNNTPGPGRTGSLGHRLGYNNSINSDVIGKYKAPLMNTNRVDSKISHKFSSSSSFSNSNRGSSSTPSKISQNFKHDLKKIDSESLALGQKEDKELEQVKEESQDKNGGN